MIHGEFDHIGGYDYDAFLRRKKEGGGFRLFRKKTPAEKANADAERQMRKRSRQMRRDARKQRRKDKGPLLGRIVPNASLDAMASDLPLDAIPMGSPRPRPQEAVAEDFQVNFGSEDRTNVQGDNTWMWVGIGLGVLVVVGGAAYYFSQRQNANPQMSAA